ncbi:hypothetical protein AVEN_113326-1 [Araneus ventricosus]|uniref:Uncharacterized protein n=1 Tax=Araneus ventricosus TaxID=182803 RepID=A0A4Y2HAI8_ARAVE|nr:hypothetical protein AVEN_113326-1 [Araneus ventricosus]
MSLLFCRQFIKPGGHCILQLTSLPNELFWPRHSFSLEKWKSLEQGPDYRADDQNFIRVVNILELQRILRAGIVVKKRNSSRKHSSPPVLDGSP